VPLESGDGGLGPFIIKAGHAEIIAVSSEHGLELQHFGTAAAGFEAGSVFDCGGGHIMAYPGLGQSPPGKMFAGVDLAAMGYIGMREHPLGPDAPAPKDIMAERYDGFDLRQGIIRQPRAMPAIGDFDPDRYIIHIAFAGPNALACMPGAPGFRYELRQAAIFPNKIMRRDLRRGIAKLPQRGLAIRQTGVMQQNRIGYPPTLANAVVGRRSKCGRQRAVGYQ
jgi:hypothetical protein